MKKSPKQKSVRLPEHVRPERYRIMLKPDLKKFTFEGEETIYLQLEKPTKEIILHAAELKISKAEFIHGKEKITANKIMYHEKDETVLFVFPRTVPKGKAELEISFRGLLNDRMQGFYRSTYMVGKKEYHIATTQFESTDARRAIPCIDEPAVKAIFDVTLMVPKHTTAISNTIPTEIAEHESGYKVVKFAPTPKMSTYLLAFIVGEFDFIEGKTKEGVLVRVFVTSGKKKQAEFALDVATRVLSFFNQYFDIPYPLPVLDMIAIPDFQVGAMENWGAVTYRETALLIDPDNSAAVARQRVALVVAHELAHQWFGNLVTMEWWTHLWLNEGFASYIEYVALDHLFPEWNMWTQFVFQDLNDALRLDSLKSTHAIEVDVHHPGEISEIFDAVSYSKGASLIRMLAEYLGEKNFRDGLRHYLKKHSYKNASTNDLWQAFEHISKKPVQRMMQNWTRKPGYPIITITEKKGQLTLKQSRFYVNPLVRVAANDATTWVIPISFIDEKGKKQQPMLMEKKSTTISIPGNSTWVKLNPGETNLVRVDYPIHYLHQFSEAIEEKKFSPRDRFGIIRDAFALAESGQLPTTEALTLAESYLDEDDYTVWTILAENIEHLGLLFADDAMYENYSRFAQNMFARITEQMGWERRQGEQHTDSILRSRVLYLYGSYGDEDTVKHAQKLFMKGNIHPDLRATVYALVAEYGGKAEHSKLLSMYRKATLQEEKNRIGRALALFKDEKLVTKSLEFFISQDVRPQDTPHMLAVVLGNPKGRDLAWKFVKKNWKLFVRWYGKGGVIMANIVRPVCTFTTSKQAADVQEFFKKNKVPGTERAVQQVLERIRSNAAWLTRERHSIADWLKNY
jgi:puromycin-sensitive aminopeptidase